MIAEKLVVISLAIIFIGIILLVISSMIAAQQQSQSKDNKSGIDVGFGGFIGPIPFGFFSSKKAFWMWLAIAAAAIAIVWILSRKVV